MAKILDLDTLGTFAAVAETGELKAAAEQVFKSHSAVCMQIKRLEAATETPLFVRRNKRMELTEKGEVFLSYARRMLLLNDAALAAVREQDLSGRISFGVPTDYSKKFIERFLPEIRSKIPNLQLKIICARSRNLRKKIQAGSIDMAIVAGEDIFSDEEFLWSEKLLWVASPSFEFDKSKELPVAIFEDDCIVRNLTINQLTESGISYSNVFSSSNLENIANAVFNGFAASLLPDSLLKNNRMKILPQEMISNSSLLKMNMIRNKPVDDLLFNTIVDLIKKIAS
jgi:DNA-binding transcriptional LysR family regulator